MWKNNHIYIALDLNLVSYIYVYLQIYRKNHALSNIAVDFYTKYKSWNTRTTGRVIYISPIEPMEDILPRAEYHFFHA